MALKIGGEPAVALATLVLTLVVLIFSEATPKTLAAVNPERLAYPAAMIYYPLLKLTYPIVWLTNACSNLILHLFGARNDQESLQALTREELRTLVHEAGSRISSRYQRMLISILDLEKVTVDDVMVPHNEIVGIDLDEPAEEIERVVRESAHSRLPVYRDAIDNVVGILHLRKLANFAMQRFDPDALIALLDEPYFVPEGTPLSTQLVQFQRRRQRIALVVDEYGDIQGIVTLEDILEEIIGEFTSDPADEAADVVREGANAWLVDGAANIRGSDRSQGWFLPTEGPKTINGLIVEMLDPYPRLPLACRSRAIRSRSSRATKIESGRSASDPGSCPQKPSADDRQRSNAASSTSASLRTASTRIPSGARFGALPRGTIAHLNPCFAAAAMRSSP